MSLKHIAMWIGLLSLTGPLTGCSNISFFLANAPTVASWEVRRSADIAYGSENRQRLDVYAPKGGNNRPIVVFFYGGTWVKGSKDEYRFVGSALAAQGIVTVLPDYRLHPAVKFPAFLEDGARALAWVQQHAAQFGGDPTRIVLMGHSAGAHEAAMLAFNRHFIKDAGAKADWIRGFVGLSGPYALDPNTPVLHTIFGSPYTIADWQPMQFVDARSPPTLLVHGQKDTLVDPRHTDRMRDALQKFNVPVTTRFYPNRNHADTVAGFAWGARLRTPVLQETMNFIDRVTTNTAPSVNHGS